MPWRTSSPRARPLCARRTPWPSCAQFQALLDSFAELHNALTTPAVPVGRKRAVVARMGGELGLSRSARELSFRSGGPPAHRLAAPRSSTASRRSWTSAWASPARRCTRRGELTEPQRGCAGRRTGTAHRQAHPRAVRGGRGADRRRGGADRLHGLRRLGARPVGDPGTPPERGRLIGRILWLKFERTK